MAIDTSGRYWRSDDPADLGFYLRAYTADAYPVTVIKDSRCGACGGAVFHLRADRDEGAARRACSGCGLREFIADSEEFWGETTPRTCTCLCKGRLFNIAVGFSLRESGEVRWVTVAQRCVQCGTLGSYVDWKIDSGDTNDLLTRA